LNQPKLSPPNLADLFLAGLDARRAHAFYKAIKANPDFSPDFWWDTLNQITENAEAPGYSTPDDPSFPPARLKLLQ
jgi:hypothetical protein